VNTCDDIRMQFDAWRDGDASRADTAIIDSHLKDCAGCRRWFAHATNLDENLAQLGRTADCLAGSSSALQGDEFRLANRKSTAGWIRLIRMSRVAAALVLVTTGVWLGVSRRTPPHVTSTLATHTPPRRPGNESGAIPTRVTLVNEPARFVEPIPSTDPHIHIVWIYDNDWPATGPGQIEPNVAAPSPIERNDP